MNQRWMSKKVVSGSLIACLWAFVWFSLYKEKSSKNGNGTDKDQNKDKLKLGGKIIVLRGVASWT